MNESAGEKLWKRRAQTALGNRRSDFHFSHSFNNNKLDDRNHFLQNAKTSVASLRRLITPTRNADHDQPGTLIIFIGIRKTQHELDFVDINPNRDIPVYLNPFVFAARSDPFSIDASRVVVGFFQHNLTLIKEGNVDGARANFQHLNEPNETCLGQSRHRPRGRGIGNDNAEDLFESILNSEAMKTGLVEHLEDTTIFIPGIRRDKVSDMTTNIIRENLIRYTQQECELLGIPFTANVPSGFFWDIESMSWQQEHTAMLVINHKRILLVPKAVVSYVKEFDASKYHRHHALEFLQEDHLRCNTRLVQVRYRKNGSIRRRFVTKKDLIKEELPADKELLANFTKKYPAIFADFRKSAAAKVQALSNSEFEEIDVDKLIDHLISKLRALKEGNKDAGAYHALMVGILEFIFYPNLINPVKEREIDAGRKRIDISFDNGAPTGGFFYRLQNTFGIPCPYIFFECKNYTEDVANPELDQMTGRFSPNRGKFGVIVCRSIEDKALFLQCQRSSESVFFRTLAGNIKHISICA
ncbi:MAG: hypothetical protein DMG58_17815, partial [Acidobacteria bacterium]